MVKDFERYSELMFQFRLAENKAERDELITKMFSFETFDQRELQKWMFLESEKEEKQSKGLVHVEAFGQTEKAYKYRKRLGSGRYGKVQYVAKSVCKVINYHIYAPAWAV